MEKINKEMLVREIAERANFTLKDVELIVDTMTQILQEAMREHIEVAITGFGILKHKKIDREFGYKPVPGVVGKAEKIKFPESYRSTFKLSESMKDKNE